MTTRTIINISAKCSDMFSASLAKTETNATGSKLEHSIGDYTGYVPSWFPNPNVEHYGDYVQLDIDVATGQIINWKRPTSKQLAETFKSEKEF